MKKIYLILTLLAVVAGALFVFGEVMATVVIQDGCNHSCPVIKFEWTTKVDGHYVYADKVENVAGHWEDNWSSGQCYGSPSPSCQEQQVCPSSDSAYTSHSSSKPCSRQLSSGIHYADKTAQHRHWIETTYQCPVGYTTYPGHSNCRKWVDTVNTSHSADVAYDKSDDPNKCHRPSDDILRDTYGMDSDARHDFKNAHGEWLDSIRTIPDGSYLGEDNLCHLKTPVCTDPKALNYDNAVSETEISDNTTCTYTPAGECPTACGYAGSSDSIPNGQGGYKVCSATATCPVPPQCTSNEPMVIYSTAGDEVNTESTAVATWVHPLWATIPGATWIWHEAQVSNPTSDQTDVFTKTINVTGNVTSASIDIASDNGYTLKINGVTIADNITEEHNYGSVVTYAITNLTTGSNTLEITVKNFALPDSTYDSNPAGLLYKLTINSETCPPPPKPPVVCPEGTTKSQTPIETVSVPSNSALPTLSSGILSSTNKYLIVPSGTWHNLPYNWSDAEYTSTDDWATHADGYDIDPWFLGEGEFDLQIDGAFVNWGDYNPSHSYSYLYTGNNSPISFGIFDGDSKVPEQNSGWYGDNEGSLSVDIYACVPNTPPPLVCDANIELIANGSFEEPALANSSWSITPDSNPLLKWLVAWVAPQEVGTLGLEIQNHVAGDPAVGNQHAELDGDHPVKISQDITTIPGATYSLNFKYSPRPGRNALDNEITVKANDNILGATLSNDGSSNSNTVWSSQTRTFSATGATTKIEFVDTGTDTSYGGYIDDVSLRCVPPTTPVDVCLNLEGTQEIIPEGYEILQGSTCTPIPPIIGVISGCTDPVATNYQQYANKDDGSCSYPTPPGPGPGNGPIVGFMGGNGPIVLGASTGEVLGESCGLYLNKHLRLGSQRNDTEQVKKLQEFLNKWLNAEIPVTGYFGPMTYTKVKEFQKMYGDNILKPWNLNAPTGLVYLTTLRQINILECPDLMLDLGELTPWSANPNAQ
jgi:hypothetical protein